PPDRRPHPAATSPAVDESAIRADRELLADLARMNSDVVPLAMRIMDDSATLAEQRTFADRRIELGTRLHDRAHQTGLVIDSDHQS
ncbi:MAG: hypothetical protein ACRDTT_09490, partial [Pseudonocardiaceae bacterium]